MWTFPFVWMELKIVSLNVRGLGKKKRKIVFEWLEDNEYDICLLQDTHCKLEAMDEFEERWQGEIFHSPSPPEGYPTNGVCIMITDDSEHKITLIKESLYHDDDGRIVAINFRLNINEDIYTIINVYAPSKNAKIDERKKLFAQLKRDIGHKITVPNKQNLIIGGDFNCTLQSDRFAKDSEALYNLAEYHKLSDIWRWMHGDDRQKTYVSSAAKNAYAKAIKENATAVQKNAASVEKIFKSSRRKCSIGGKTFNSSKRENSS